jgi:hypothetical protein
MSYREGELGPGGSFRERITRWLMWYIRGCLHRKL